MSLPPLTRPRVLLVDDDAAQLEILAHWLANSGFEPVTAADGFSAIAALQAQGVDAVVTDLRMPGMDGLQLASILRELDPKLEVVFLSGQGTLDDAVEALRQGRAFDFLQKPLRDLYRLNVVLDKALANRRGRGIPARPVPPPPPQAATPRPEAFPAHLEPLSPAELRLIGLLACGYENRRIADELGYSDKTVRNYLSRIYEKLQVGSRLQAVALCQRHGLIERGTLATAS